MKKSIFYLIVIFSLLSCGELDDFQEIEEITETKIFSLHPDFRFGPKLVQKLYSDGEALYVAGPDGVRYYTDNPQPSFFHYQSFNTINPTLNFFLDENWAVTPNERFQGLVIHQKTYSRFGYPFFTPKDFPSVNYSFLKINQFHPTYSINGENLLFAVTRFPDSADLILAKLSVIDEGVYGLLIDTHEDPLKEYYKIDLRETLSAENISVDNIYNLNNNWIVSVRYRFNGEPKNAILLVNDQGEVQTAETLMNSGIDKIRDITTNHLGDYFILGHEGFGPDQKIIKLPNGNYDSPSAILQFSVHNSDLKLRIIDNQIIIFDNTFPLIYHVDLDSDKDNVINTSELGFVTFTDIIQHQGSVYIGTNNGLFSCKLEDFWNYMDPSDFLESGQYEDLPELTF